MNILKLTVQSASKRPVIFILPAVLALVLSAINCYNPVLPVLLGISGATGGSIFDGVISALQLITDPALIPAVAIFLACAVVILTLLAGVILSGYFHIVRNTLAGNEKSKGDFGAGMGKYLLKVSTITLRAVLFMVLISGVIIVATVPAIIITRAASTTRPELMLAAVFVDFLTAAIVFFGLMFTRIYLFYWYPAAFNDVQKPFRYAKSLVDGHFWQIVLRFLVFDVVFVVFAYLIIITTSTILKLLLGWIFAAVFLTVLSVYVFHSFGEIMISNGQDDRP